jgi:hypothetical protein
MYQQPGTDGATPPPPGGNPGPTGPGGDDDVIDGEFKKN